MKKPISIIMAAIACLLSACNFGEVNETNEYYDSNIFVNEYVSDSGSGSETKLINSGEKDSYVDLATTVTSPYPVIINSYITLSLYISDGSIINEYHGGKVYIDGANYVANDDGFRIAEDTGGAIKGYHIDVFAEFMAMAEFYQAYASYLNISNGYYFPVLIYDTTLNGDIN